MQFENEALTVTKFEFDANTDADFSEDSTIQLEAGEIDTDIVVFAKTIANYQDEEFSICAHFTGKFKLTDVKLENIEKSREIQEELSKRILEKVYNKLNLYVSLFSQEVYPIPIYPSKIEIKLNEKNQE